MEFYEEFKTILKIKEDDDAFEKLFVVWMPIIKMLEAKGKLVSVLTNLTEVIINQDLQQMWNITAKWINKLLEICEMSGKKHSKHFVELLGKVMKHPNATMNIFLER